MTNHYVLIRGLVRGSGHWGQFLEILKTIDPTSEVELYEIPGNGTRFQEITPLDAIDIINDFRKRSEFCRAQKPFILLGVSLGGMLALKWLEQFPGDVQKTFIVNSSLQALSPFYQRFNYKNYLDIVGTLLTRSFEEREHKILKLTSNNKNNDAKIVKQFIEFSKSHPTSRSNFFRQLTLARNIDIKKELRQPIKVIQSEKDRLVHPECSAKLAHYLDGVLITHPTAGHDIPLDDPKWLAELISQS